MAQNFSFNRTQEDVEKQEALSLRQQEAYIQQRTQERNRKLEKLNKKNKRNRIILILLFIIFFIGMLVFGTYNTFFKDTLSEQEITELVANRMETFNTAGVEGFLHNSVADYFKASSTPGDESDIEKYELDPNSVRVTRILIVNKTTAIVYFNANVSVKLNDGFTQNGDQREKYIGETTYNSYQFRVFLTFKDKGYHYSSALELQPLLLNDDYNYEKMEEAEVISFEDHDEVEDQDKVNAIKIKVDKILADLYEGKPAGSDSDTNNFNTEDTYLGITDFKIYTEPNLLGLNAVCSYRVETIDHITMVNTVYLKVSSNGKDNWKIESLI